jgi:hypothetical protein
MLVYVYFIMNDRACSCALEEWPTHPSHLLRTTQPRTLLGSHSNVHGIIQVYTIGLSAIIIVIVTLIIIITIITLYML